MIKRIVTSAAIKHTVWIYSKMMTIATTKYTMDLWWNICKCQTYITPITAWEERWYQCSLLISQGLQLHRTWYILSHVNKWIWGWTWGKSTDYWSMMKTTNSREENHQWWKWFPRYHNSDKFLDFIPRWCAKVDRKKSVEGRPWCILHHSTWNKGRWGNDQIFEWHRGTGTKDWIRSKLQGRRFSS